MANYIDKMHKVYSENQLQYTNNRLYMSLGSLLVTPVIPGTETYKFNLVVCWMCWSLAWKKGELMLPGFFLEV